jgi:SAM-dependent methyltransferase
MDDVEIKELVRARYGGIAAAREARCCAPAASSCCGDTAPGTPAEKSRQMGYSEAELAAVPDGANLGLGCGNPQAIAALKPGEVVIDLGSGAGFDCFLATRQVGDAGHVIGVDMTHEMLKKARDNAARIGAANVEFRLGELEHLPVADQTADVVMSNCVINLVPDKEQVFREAFRVLRPGGRLAVTDIINTAPLSAELQADPTLLCGCVAGAAPAERIEGWLAGVGFVDVRVTPKPESRELVRSWAPGRSLEDHVVSAMVEARKP